MHWHLIGSWLEQNDFFRMKMNYNFCSFHWFAFGSTMAKQAGVWLWNDVQHGILWRTVSLSWWLELLIVVSASTWRDNLWNKNSVCYEIYMKLCLQCSGVLETYSRMKTHSSLRCYIIGNKNIFWIYANSHISIKIA